MIGEEQAKGYAHLNIETSQPEESENEFEARKKRALAMIQRKNIDDLDKTTEIRGEEALKNYEALENHKRKVLEHDIIILRQQNEKIIESLNELTKSVKEIKKMV